MAFLKNIATGSDFMSLGQGQILGNFQQMNTTMAVDHYAFDDATAANGKHKDCRFVAGVKPELVNTDIGIFSKLVTYATLNPTGTENINEIFFENRITGSVLTTDIANPGKVTTTAAHNLATGDIVVISGIVGATGYNATFTIIVTSSTQFTVGVSAVDFGVYISGGTWISSSLVRQISGRVVNEASGECPLFGGLGLKWGSFSFNSISFTVFEQSINYINTALVPELRLRNFTTTYAVIASIDFDVYQTRSTNIYTKNLSSTGFTIGRTGVPSSPRTYQAISGKWIAIGKV